MITPASERKGDSPSGSAANALSARHLVLAFLLICFRRELVRAAQPRACQDKLKQNIFMDTLLKKEKVRGINYISKCYIVNIFRLLAT